VPPPVTAPASSEAAQAYSAAKAAGCPFASLAAQGWVIGDVGDFYWGFYWGFTGFTILGDWMIRDFLGSK
jgi:hypothetical protein